MTGSGPVRVRWPDGRWHFQHGPIDLVIGIDGEASAADGAIEDCWLAFADVLPRLVQELKGLRLPWTPALHLAGPVARRMSTACAPFARDFGLFITPMAAVAGSVADHLIATLRRPGIDRAYINNGGDIALFLTPGTSFDVGVVSNPVPPLFRLRGRIAAGAERGQSWLQGEIGAPIRNPSPAGAGEGRVQLDGTLSVDADTPVRGVATSGWRGRSFSLGIADSVTILGADGASADAAATMIANHVNVEHPAIERAPADTLRDDTDLGSRLVTVDVPVLPASDVESALERGLAFARRCRERGLIHAALLTLQGRTRMLNPNVAEALLP